MAAVVVEDEVDKLREELSDMWDDETRLLNPDPAKRYKLVNSNPRRIAHYKKRGYKITPASGQTKLLGATKSDDGGMELGDSVLMETSMENFIKAVKKRDAFGQWRAGNIGNEMKDNINRIARNEARVPAHTDVAFDQSREGD